MAALENRLRATFGVGDIRSLIHGSGLEDDLRQSGQYRFSVVDGEVSVRLTTIKPVPTRGAGGRAFGVVQHYDPLKGFGFVFDDARSKHYFRDDYVGQESRSLLVLCPRSS